MMSFTQYVLSKVAEEATELAKEALKGQQQGLFSDHRGRKNYEYIQDEYIDLIARSTLLSYCDDVIAQGTDKFSLLVDRHDLSIEANVKMQRSIDKMCYYAYMSYQNGYLALTSKEQDLVEHHYNQHVTRLNNQTE